MKLKNRYAAGLVAAIYLIVQILPGTSGVYAAEIQETVNSSEISEIQKAVSSSEVPEIQEAVNSSEISEVQETVNSSEISEVQETVNSSEIKETSETVTAVDTQEAASENVAQNTTAGNEAQKTSYENVAQEAAGQDSLTEGSKVEMVFDEEGMAQPIIDFSAVSKNYTNTDSDILRFVVYVETDLDTDLDGKNDLVKAMVEVPRAAAEGDYKAPVIYEASPYLAGTVGIYESWGNPDGYINHIFKPKEIEGFSEDQLYQAGNKRTPSANVISTLDWSEKQDTSDWYYTYKVDDKETTNFLSTYNNHDYFLIRGYAVVVSAGLGTKGSEGLETCGSRAEADAFKNIIEWINGKRMAYTDKEHNVPIEAEWASGSVGMEGTSYNGTMAFEVATTGVEGLKTVVPEEAISSWYRYSNQQGQASYPWHFYQQYLASMCASRFFGSTLKNQALDDGCKTQDGKSVLDLYQGLMHDSFFSESKLKGGWDDYWEERNFSTVSKDSVQVKVPALIVQGMQDWNVRSDQAKMMKYVFDEEGQGNDTRVLLHIDGHTTPDNIPIKTKTKERSYKEILNLWFSHFLTDHKNGILDELAPYTVESNIDASFDSYDDWDSEEFLVISSNIAEDEQKITKLPTETDNTASLSPSPQNTDIMRSAVDMTYDLDSFLRDIPDDTVMDESEIIYWNTEWTQNIYSDITINGMPYVDLRIKAENVSYDDILVGAMLYDISDQEFESYELNNRYGYLTKREIDSRYYMTESEFKYFEKDSNSEGIYYETQLNEIVTSPVHKHLITKGHLSLKAPLTEGGNADFYDHEIDKRQDIEADKYYTYRLFLPPTVYTVKAGHRLVLYLMGASDGILSKSSFTIDNTKSAIKIPVTLPEGVSLNQVTRLENDIDVDVEYKDDIGHSEKKEYIEGENVSTVLLDYNSGKNSQTGSIWVSGLYDSYIWQGSKVTLDDDLRVYDGTRLLRLGSDYKLSYKNNNKANDNASVTVKFIGEYKGNMAVKKTFAIEKADLSLSDNVIVEDDLYTVDTGRNQKPYPDIVYASYTDVPKNQLTVTYRKKNETEEYSAVNEEGQYDVIIRPKSDKCSVEGEKIISLTVLPKEEAEKQALSKAKVTLSANKFVFANSYITPEPELTMEGINKGKILDSEAYTVEYVNNFYPGTAKMVIRAVENNKYGLLGSVTKTFNITKGRKLEDYEGSPFKYTAGSAYYSLAGAKSNVKVYDGETLLEEGKDYTLSFSNNKKVTDSAVVTIKGKGNYTGSVKRNYSVCRISIGSTTAEAEDKFGHRENGYKNPTITLTDKSGKKLVKNRDYKIVDYKDKGNGSYTVILEGKGNYNGKRSLDYRYLTDNSLNLAKVKVAQKIPDQTYSLNGVKLDNNDLNGVLVSSNGTALVLNKDYVIHSYKNNKKAGTATIILKGKDPYAGIKTLKFKINDGKKRNFLGWLIDNIWNSV
ncbi:MAG: hypothetical protein K5931_00430 [Lachnospiraceae bacterium]|nr:hypothetical protein [Lachnospiraceae bacterium]